MSSLVAALIADIVLNFQHGKLEKKKQQQITTVAPSSGGEGKQWLLALKELKQFISW